MWGRLELKVVGLSECHLCEKAQIPVVRITGHDWCGCTENVCRDCFTGAFSGNPRKTKLFSLDVGSSGCNSCNTATTLMVWRGGVCDCNTNVCQNCIEKLFREFEQSEKWRRQPPRVKHKNKHCSH